MTDIKEFHLFAGIGGGIYGGKLLGHTCCGGVEIDDFCKQILSLRQQDGWMDSFDIYGDITELNGAHFRGSFDILCGGFPCQAFSHAAHGNNISEKNLWREMFRFAEESEAPIVFGENVTFKAIDTARNDLESLGYKVKVCKLSCGEIGADHQRNRYWLLAVKDENIFEKVKKHILSLPKFKTGFWSFSPFENSYESDEETRRRQLKAIGNAQSPLVAASAFRILVSRHIKDTNDKETKVSQDEIDEVVERTQTWIKGKYGVEKGFVHTPTTMANYSCKSMMKHQGCRNYNEIFGRPRPSDAEYLMGFPIGASILDNNGKDNYESWIERV